MWASSYEEASRQLGYDPLIPQIMLKGTECGGVDTEMIQKTFLIGYARAARIILQLEDLKYISCNCGKKKEVLLSYEDFVRDYIKHCLQE